MSFAFVIDWRKYGQGLVTEIRRTIAVRMTVAGGGVGEVVCSARKKMSWERGTKVPHGAMIANILRNQGHDPFDYPADLAAQAHDLIEHATQQAVSDAWDTARDQSARVRTALTEAAELLANTTAQRIKDRALGDSVGKYEKRKAIMVNRGRGSSDYGRVPPVGVLTGRFVDGIRARWRRGRRAGGA